MNPETRLTEQEIESVFKVMKGESDRGCVLVGAAMIEEQMKRLLTQIFLDRHKEQTPEIKQQINVILDPLAERSILGGAAARARMCRVLALISEDIHKLLKQFFTFRNQHFAHAHADVKLTDSKIAASLAKLDAMVPGDFRDVRMTQSAARDKYIMIVVTLYYILNYHFGYWKDYGV